MSAENKMLFQSEPEKYAPQFGGFCAYGATQGHKAPTEPDAWTIVNNKLYLNYNKEVMAMWQKDTVNLIPKAVKNWVVIKDQKQ